LLISGKFSGKKKADRTTSPAESCEVANITEADEEQTHGVCFSNTASNDPNGGKRGKKE